MGGCLDSRLVKAHEVEPCASAKVEQRLSALGFGLGVVGVGFGVWGLRGWGLGFGV